MYKFYRVEECENTQDLAIELALKDKEAVLVLADHQRKGRGRLGRPWISHHGAHTGGLSLTCSYAFKKSQLSDLKLLSLWAGAALTLALEKLSTELSILAIKWPNDVGIFEKENNELKFKKVAGILVESRRETICAGWGVNLQGRVPWPDAITIGELIPDGSLAKGIEDIAHEITRFFCRGLDELQSQNPDFEDKLLDYVGQSKMSTFWGYKLGHQWQGHTACGLSSTGALVARNSASNIVELSSGAV